MNEGLVLFMGTIFLVLIIIFLIIYINGSKESFESEQAEKELQDVFRDGINNKEELIVIMGTHFPSVTRKWNKGSVSEHMANILENIGKNYLQEYDPDGITSESIIKMIHTGDLNEIVLANITNDYLDIYNEEEMVRETLVEFIKLAGK